MNKSINLNLLLDVTIMALILAIGFLIPNLFSSNSQEGFKNPFKKPFKKLEKQFKKLQKKQKKPERMLLNVKKDLKDIKINLQLSNKNSQESKDKEIPGAEQQTGAKEKFAEKNIKLNNQEKMMKGQAREIAHLDEAGDKLRQRIVKRRSDTFNNDDLKV